MKSAAPPPDEARRLEVLRRYHVLDTPVEQPFDDLTTLAAQLCDVPIAIIALVDDQRLWMKSAHGVPLAEIPRDLAFCTHAILQRDVFVVPDARCDERFADNPLVTGEPHVRFYASAPLVSAEGHALGTLSVADRIPRELTPAQSDALRMLSRQAMTQMELRRQARELHDSEARLMQVFASCPVAVTIHRLSDRTFVDVNDAFTRLMGWTRDEVIGRRPTELKIFDEAVADDLLSRLSSTGTLRDVEVAARTRDGEMRHMLLGVELAELRAGTHAVTTLVDITERKAAEEAVRVNENRLATIVETEPECVKIIDGAGRLIELNPAGLAMLEAESLSEVQQGRLIDYVLPEYRDAFAALHARVMDGATGRLAFEIRGRRGGRRWVETHAAPLRGADGSIQALLGVTHDITERRKAEQSIQHLNRVYAVLSETNQTIVRQADPPAIFAAACRTAVEKGLFRMAWIGLARDNGGLEVIAHAGASPEALRLIRSLIGAPAGNVDCTFTWRALQTGRHAVCNDIEHHPQAAAWGPAAIRHGFRALAALPLRQGDRSIGTFNLYSSEVGFFDQAELELLAELTANISFALDIHGRELERRRVEAALRDSEERFRQLAENIQEVFWMIDPEKGQILYVSPAYERVWGRSRGSLYAASRSWLDAVHPDDRPRVQHALDHHLTRGLYDETYRIHRPDGTLRWIHDRGFVIPGADGRPPRVVGTAEDITDRRKLEDQLRQSQKMEAIGQLAGGVAHDFNNLLTIIQGYGSLLLTEEATADDVAEAAEQIVQASERAANLTRQLLTFSRQTAMQRQRLDLNVVVTGLTKMLQRILGEDVHLQLNLHPRPLLVVGDQGLLDQVLMNLAINARDAMPQGGRLVIETAESALPDRPVAGRGASACIRVTDSGSGIAPEHLSRIFEPFFTTKPPGKGTGLGLATAFGIIEQHGGVLRASSELGRGATFEVELPIDDTEDPPAEDTPFKSLAAGGTETILLVEDEQAVRTLTRIVLERHGYRVLEAAHGVEAVRVWNRHEGTVDLLLTDMVMPEGMSGRELAARLTERNPRLRVIFTSGYNPDTAGQSPALEPGYDFIPKPTTPQQLLETVRRMLDN